MFAVQEMRSLFRFSCMLYWIKNASRLHRSHSSFCYVLLSDPSLRNRTASVFIWLEREEFFVNHGDRVGFPSSVVVIRKLRLTFRKLLRRNYVTRRLGNVPDCVKASSTLLLAVISLVYILLLNALSSWPFSSKLLEIMLTIVQILKLSFKS